MAHILIIDDDNEIRSSLRIVLTKDGHKVTEASDGIIGIEAFQKDRADLVITDIIMPNKEGIETMMELHEEEHPPKIIAISGGSSRRSVKYLEIAEMLGADCVLEKPIQLGTLREEVKRLLSVELGE